MIPIRHFARSAALLLAVALIASCDTRAVTGPQDSTPQVGGGDPTDVEKPTISFKLSVGTNNTVDVGAALTVTVTSTDNVGVQTMYTSVNNGPSVIGSDTTVLKPVQLTAVRTIPVSMSGLQNGDKLIVRTTVGDASLNFASDSLIITMSDTTAPKVTLASAKAAPGLSGGDTLDVRVTANDSAGIKYVGYRIVRYNPTDTVQVFAESISVAAGTRPTSFAPPTWKWPLPDSLLTGSYGLIAFGMDASGILSRPNPFKNFTVVDGKKPTLTFISPVIGSRLNVGDSLLVTARLQDNIGISKVTFFAKSARGNPDLGTADTVQRYATLVAPQTGVFHAGLRDTTISRYLKVLTPIDTLADSLIVTGILADAATPTQLADTERVIIRMATGPKVRFLAPVAGDSATPAAGLTVTLRATHPVGVAKLGFRMQGATTWLTPLDTTVAPAVVPSSKDYTFSATIPIPANATPKTIITITPISVDVDGQEGSSAPMFIPVRLGAPPGPVVYQNVPARMETTDSIAVTASGNGLTWVGFELRDATNALVKRDSVSVGPPPPSAAVINLGINLPASIQGKRLAVKTFAWDIGGRIGYSVAAQVTASQPNITAAFVDSTLIVYGHTYYLPGGRTATLADIAVDRARGNVFATNNGAGRLEVWQNATQSFDPTGVVVGSQPWGMTFSRSNPDTLYVANSGGTNISRVFIGSSTPSAMGEDLAHRMLTRMSLMYKVSEGLDATGHIRLLLTGPIMYSDRPQYVEQSATGRLYLSTKPTLSTKLKGTIRYLEPSHAAPDERFILAFASRNPNLLNTYLVANVDSMGVTAFSSTSSLNDVLTICDHATGTTNPSVCASGNTAADAVAALRAAVPTTDVEIGANLDESSLELTDTTYAASSGDGKWIAFGEGNRAPFSRAFLLQDDGSVADKFNYAAPSININDLINNASDQVMGIALDKTGKTLAVHGSETYFAAVTNPFTQRLQGKKTTFSVGAGLAFHPNADGTTTPQSDRLAFVASNNGTIELVDIAYYDFNRGTIATKNNLVGPIRASLPFPGDDPSVVLKLFGISNGGLVVINVTQADIKPGPP
jgi:hypothetical protein